MVEGTGGALGIPTDKKVRLRTGTSVRYVFDLNAHLQSFATSLGLPVTDAEQKFDLEDLQIERRQQIDSGEFTGWSALPLDQLCEPLERSLGLDPEVVFPTHVRSEITMPLPRRRSGEWTDTNASHKGLTTLTFPEREVCLASQYRLRQEAVALKMMFPGDIGEMQGFRRFALDEVDLARVFPDEMSATRLRNVIETLDSSRSPTMKPLSDQIGDPDDFIKRTRATPELLLVRFFDLISSRGQTYQYRVRIQIRNPLFGIAEDKLEQKELAHVPSLFTSWSDPTPPVFVPESFRYYPLEGQAADSGPFAMYLEIEDAGTPAFTDKLAVPIGTRIGGKVTVDVVDLGKDTLEPRDVEFETGHFLAAVTPAPAVSKGAAPLLKDFFNAGGSFPSRCTVIDSNGAIIVRYSGDSVRVDGEKISNSCIRCRVHRWAPGTSP